MKIRRSLFVSRHLNWGAIQIAGLYLLTGGLWILFSDKVAASIALDRETFITISLYKGLGYVLVTALLLYWVIRRHTAALNTGEMQLQRVMDALPALISYVDADRRYQFTNNAYEEWFNHTAQGKLMEEVIGKVAYKTISKYVDKVLAGETVSYETEIPYQDGGARFVHAHYVPDKRANGQVRGFFAMVEDISEQKQAQEERRLWADAFEGCAHGIAIGDPHTNRILVCNPAFASMHKCRVEDIIGTGILSLYVPSNYELVRRGIEKADQIGHSRFEANMVRRDRSTFPAEVDVVSVLGDDGDLLHRVVTAQDISEHTQAEKILQESEERYRIVSELTSDYAYKDRVEADGSIIPEWFTESFTRITGYTLEETQAPDFWQRILHPDDFPILLRHAQKILSGQPDTDEMRVFTKSGEVRWLRDFANPVWDADQGRVTGLYGAVQDVTESKRAEEILRASEERYRTLIEQASDGIFVADAQGKYTEVNTSGCTMLGYTREEILGLTLHDVIDHDDLAAHPLRLKELQEKKTLLTERKMRRKDGSTFFAELSAKVLPNGHYQGILRDVTERKQAENSLRTNQEQLLSLIKEAPISIAMFDREMRYIATSQRWISEYGRGHTDLVGRSHYEIHPDISEQWREAHQRGQAGETLKSDDDMWIQADGTKNWLRWAIVPWHDAEGNIGGIIISAEDITERKQAEEALQRTHDELERKVQKRTAALSEANALLQALMDNVPDHIYFKDTQSRFIRNSRSQTNALGLSDPAQAVGKSDFDFFPHAAKAYEEEQEVMKSGKPLIDFEEWVVWPDGRETWVSTTKMPLRDASGQTIGIFGISRDITERKRTEQAIRQLNTDLEKQAAELQTANKELEAFSYSVSHDLRAPLRAIDGYTRILIEDYESILDSEGKRVCNVISKEARRMGQLIDDLLYFSRLGRREMHSSRIDMKALAVSVFNELIKEEKSERIDFQIAKLPSVKGDITMMRQVWMNLLSNAVKFTSKKERAVIEVGSKPSKDELIYYVRDTGTGFDMEYSNKLFGVFQRLHSESEFSGTGVGLAIVQRIIRRHGGRVWAEGEVDKGATFYFALPRKENHHG
jgi:PAS domain S-box-containing protein